MPTFEIFDLFFNYQVKLMYAGIEVTMKKESLQLCALALSTYTEIMGGLVTGKLKEDSHSRENYEAFLPYLGKGYVELNQRIIGSHRNTLVSLYKAVRNKLVHEFSLRSSYAIWISEVPNNDRIGIELIVNKIDQHMSEHLNFHVREYYRDFKNGVTKYHDDLKFSECQPAFSDGQILFMNFMKAVVENFHSE